MDIAKFIDHSLLRPSHTRRELEEEIKKCLELGVYGICVNPFWVGKARELAGNGLVVCSVISFPFGLDKKEHKILQSIKAMEEGAQELDIVMNLSAFKSGMISYVEEELRSIARETEGAVRKVIIETASLSKEEKELALRVVEASGVEFVKTSTGYGPGGATEEDVKLLVELARGRLKVKASGGIRSFEQAVRFLKLGADRIGTSNTFEILRGR
ncbi:MAG: deoxyribose-phosphate aldolase [Aquificaceae bacterium]|nr:deoxyribose-phosphate aldolase [Aquificaceae bacterium]